MNFNKYNTIFIKYVKRYDLLNENIVKKIVHTFAVAETAFFIANNLNLSEEEVLCAYVTGLTHDYGRFAQFQKYKTYNDNVSVDHANLGAEILKTEILNYNLPKKWNEIVIEAVRCHNKPCESKDEKVQLMYRIICSADSYSNVISSAQGSREFKEDDGFTPSILEEFNSRIYLTRKNIKTKLDRMFLSLSNVYNTHYDFLKKEMIIKGCVKLIYNDFVKYLNENDAKILKRECDKLQKELETIKY